MVLRVACSSLVFTLRTGGARASRLRAMSTIIQSRPIAPHVPTTCPNPGCGAPGEFALPSPPPPAGAELQIRCWHCQAVQTHAFKPQHAGPSTVHHAQTPPPPARKTRKIGTQEKPLETAYYDLLGVPVDATTDEIKKAYRRAAIKHHPDKNRDDPNAEERFKEVAVAYQTLADPALRRKYNEFGPRESAPEGGFVDPEEMFGAMFGGERFAPLIGRISLAADMKTAMQDGDEGDEGAPPDAERRFDAKGKEIISPEERARREAKERKVAAEKAAARAERVEKLVETLERKLAVYAEQATGLEAEDREVANGWRTICGIEANELKGESFGVELLHAIGFVYTSKARAFLARAQTFLGVGGWIHAAQGRYHVFSETVGTVRAAIELKAVFDQIARAERDGALAPEEKARLETQAAEKGIQALFKGTKLEIDSVLREVCDRVLEDPAVDAEKRRLRAVALQIMGEQYAAVRKDVEDERDEAEYVRVETKASREREQRGT